MTGFNNNGKFVPQTPKTFQVLELRDQQQLAKKSNLSASARSKVVNRSGSNYLSENKGYGPCSYSGCPYPNVPFDVGISIDGMSRNWACRSHVVSWFPGNWKYSSHMLGDYYWKGNLWLNQINQVRSAISAMNGDSLYVTNAAGLFCVENSKFCNNAKDIINKCISCHERGGKVDEEETISSDLHKYAKWTVKTVAIAAASTIAPGATAVVGAGTWATFKAAEEFTDPNEYDKKILQSNSSFGGDLFRAGVGGWISEKLVNTKGLCKDVYGNKVTEGIRDVTGSAAEAAAEHEYHRANGIYYDSDCPICK